MRLRSDLVVSAYLRRSAVEGASAVLRRRGAPEAGAIFVKIDRLDGTCALFGPAPESELAGSGRERLWARVHKDEWLDCAAIEARLAREIGFDSDLWCVEVEDRAGRHFLDVA